MLATAATIAALPLFTSCGGGGDLKVESLTCEWMSEPNSIDVKAPRLSWVNTPVDRNAKGLGQSAYRIIVASSLADAKKGEGDLWDSGVVESDQSYLVPFSGNALKSGQDCYWKVKVWDQDGQESSWSKISHWTMGIMDPSEWKAQWIGAPWHEEQADRQDKPAPLFRKEFSLDKKVKNAKAFVTGLGYFEFYVNGKRIGDECLAPNFTDYTVRENLPYKGISISNNFRNYRVMYLVYDVTEELVKGENVAGLIVGNGFYNTFGTRWTEAFGSPRMICQIKVDYTDGTSEMILSDTSWKVRESAIRMNDVYRGEVYDAREETPGWCTAELDDSSWDNAVPRKAPSGIMTASSAPIDRVTETFNPLSLEKNAEGNWEVDFGTEVSGWIRFKDIEGNRGDTLRVKFICESPVGDEVYIFKGGQKESYTPRFSWYVFSKAVISGVENLTVNNLVSEAVNTPVSVDSEFSSSNQLLVDINRIWQRSQIDNMHGAIASDCPHRERSPYTGDGQVAASVVMGNFDAAAFYQKWIRDINDNQNVDDGYVPNGAPWQPGCGGGVPWGAAMNVMPWDFYMHYGDVKMLEDNYFAMTEQVRYMTSWMTPEGTMFSQRANLFQMQRPPMAVQGSPRRTAPSQPQPNYWLNLGDWCAPGQNPSEEVVHTFYFWYCTRVTAEAAKVLGKQADYEKYKAMADDIAEAFHVKFYNRVTKSYGEHGENVFALVIGVPEEDKADVVATLYNELAVKNNKHLNTGIFATRFLFEVLARYGMNDLAYEIMNQTDQPSYGYWVAQGSSVTWEQWNGGGSHNHPMFGGGLTWLYDCLAGVNLDLESPGYKHVVIEPYVVEGLGSVSYTKSTPYGKLTSSVTQSDGKHRLDVTIPVGCTATVIFGGKTEEVNQGNYSFEY